MTLIRWTLTDATVPETWTFPINPNVMASPFAAKKLTTTPGGGSILTTRDSTEPFEWTFGGVSRGKIMHDDLLDWIGRKRNLLVTDHFARSFTILPVGIEFTDKRSAVQSWRFTYQVRTYMMDQPGGGIS